MLNCKVFFCLLQERPGASPAGKGGIIQFLVTGHLFHGSCRSEQNNPGHGEMSITHKYFLLGKLRGCKPQAVNKASAFLNPYLPLAPTHCVCVLPLLSISVQQGR